MLGARFWKNFDWILLGVTGLLVTIGLVVIYATTFKEAGQVAPADVRNQIVYALLGLLALVLVAHVDYRAWRKLTTWMYFGSILLLVIVRLAGRTVLGGQRWISLGFFQLQPSELTKLVLIVVLSKFFSERYEQMDRPGNLLLSLGYVALPFGLVLAQPDLGTAMVLVVIWLVMVLATPVRKLWLASMGVALLAGYPLVYRLLKPYQRDRLSTFLDPTANPLGSGYNVVQSTIAVGSGQWIGRGLGAGSQSQLNFLPSQHTDFIFAVLSEKMGFVGSSLLLLLFATLLLRALTIAWRARDRFGMFLSLGIVAMFLFHMFINVGMNLGIMPVTGIPLPFVSYGGTSLLVGMIAVGILESVAVRRKKIEFGV
jgi:rod shape determining protein RodA